MFELIGLLLVIFLFYFCCGAAQGVIESRNKRIKERGELEINISKLMNESDSLDSSIESVRKK